MNPEIMNTNALAFIGDGVYEVYIREYVLSMGTVDVNKLHRLAVGYVKAEAQCLVMKSLLDELDDGEMAVVRRARNHKQRTKAKSADIITYKWATAFEALIGYLYYKKDIERMEYIIKRGIEITEGSYE